MDQHLDADQSQNRHQRKFQIAEPAEQIGQREVQASQPEDRKHVRGKNQKRIVRQTNHGGNRIDREHEIGRLHNHEGQEQRCHRQLAVDLREKVVLHKAGMKSKEPSRQTDHPTVLEVHLVIAGEQHLDRRDQQKQAEHVSHPVETVNQLHSDADHHAPHHQRTEDSPQQHAMLIGCRDLEVSQHQRNHEDVIDAQRLFENVAHEEHDGCFPATLRQQLGGVSRVTFMRHGLGCLRVVDTETEPVGVIGQVNETREQHGQAEVNGRPDQGGSRRQGLLFTAREQAQIECQNQQHQQHKSRPNHRSSPFGKWPSDSTATMPAGPDQRGRSIAAVPSFAQRGEGMERRGNRLLVQTRFLPALLGLGIQPLVGDATPFR